MCDIHGFGSNKGKTCSYTIARYCNYDEKYFASASTCRKHQRAIETAITGRGGWRERECVAQEACITIEAGEDVESVVDEIATMAERIDSRAGADPATIEHTADEEEDTDEHMEGTILEHWADAGVDSA